LLEELPLLVAVFYFKENVLEIIKSIIQPDQPPRPYLPYLAAVESGAIKPEDLIPEELGDPLGVLLANRKIPAQQAGLVLLGQQSHVCDHNAVIDYAYDRLFLGSSSKKDVNKLGEIHESGLIVLTRPNGILKVIGIAITPETHPWLANGDNLGNVAVKLFGLEAMQFEAVDIDGEGIISARRITPTM